MNKIADLPTYKIYLAGPEVFLSNAKQVGECRKKFIADFDQENKFSFSLEGLFPIDNNFEDVLSNNCVEDIIFGGNIGMMDSADIMLVNMVAFRGPSMDVGAVFEMGYMFYSGKPIFGYYDATDFPESLDGFDLTQTYKDRVKLINNLDPKATQYPEGVEIENFGLVDNLMMVCAIQRTGYPIADSFETAIKHVVEYLDTK